MVHRRQVNGQELVFGNQGALWGNAMTWWDTETGSVWSQPLGEAILGPQKGTTLELLPSTLSSWADWKRAHPETFALDVHSEQDGFDLDSMAIVVELGPESVAYTVDELRSQAVINHEVSNVPVAVVLEPDTDSWHVFSRQLDGDVIELQLVDGELHEIDGPRRFDLTRGLPLGDGVEGLDLLPGFTSFPDDYVTFFPTGSFWTPGGAVPAQSTG